MDQAQFEQPFEDFIDGGRRDGDQKQAAWAEHLLDTPNEVRVLGGRKVLQDGQHRYDIKRNAARRHVIREVAADHPETLAGR